MIGYEAFSSCRLGQLFPNDPTLWPSDPEMRQRRSLNTEYLGGLGNYEAVDGVQLWFPQADEHQAGTVTISAGEYVRASALRSNPYSLFTGPYVDARWAANANRMLKALGLRLEVGSDEASVVNQCGS